MRAILLITLLNLSLFIQCDNDSYDSLVHDFIGHQPRVDPLVQALRDHEDWNFVLLHKEQFPTSFFNTLAIDQEEISSDLVDSTTLIMPRWYHVNKPPSSPQWQNQVVMEWGTWHLLSGTEAYIVTPKPNGVLLGFGASANKDKLTGATAYFALLQPSGALAMPELTPFEVRYQNRVPETISMALPSVGDDHKVLIGIGLRSYNGKIRTIQAWTAPFNQQIKRIQLNSPSDITVYVYTTGPENEAHQVERLIRTFDTPLGAELELVQKSVISGFMANIHKGNVSRIGINVRSIDLN